jgi:hypothetical protein
MFLSCKRPASAIRLTDATNRDEKLSLQKSTGPSGLPKKERPLVGERVVDLRSVPANL